MILAAAVLTPGPHTAHADNANRLQKNHHSAPDVTALLDRHGLSGARVGYQAIDLNSGREMAAQVPDASFIPASTAKVITAAAALGVLGPEFRFRTSLFTTGKVDNGVLQGDLYLKGTGDPLLSVQNLMALAQALKDHGIRRIAGGLYVDQSHLPHVPAIDPDQPASAPYNAGVSALTLDFNRVRIHWRHEDDKAIRAEMSPSPGTGSVVVDPENVPPHAFAPTSQGGPESWEIEPAHLTQSQGYRELPIRGPSRRTAAVFRDLAKALGIDLPPPQPGTVPPDAREIVGIDSTALARMIRPALDYSNNVVSELIGLTAARKLGGVPVSLAQSSGRVLGWLAGQVGDLDISGIELPNHSGLSATARISPRQMVRIVGYALRQRYGAERFLAMFPAGGWRDSLGSRFQWPAVAGRVWAKSGTLHYATGVVGVVFSRAGRQIVFALFVMDDQRRTAYDSDPARESPESQASAKAWIRNAKAFEEELISAWIGQH